MFNLRLALTDPAVKKAEKNVRAGSSLGIRSTARKSDESGVKSFSGIGGSVPTINHDVEQKKVEKQESDVWGSLPMHF